MRSFFQFLFGRSPSQTPADGDPPAPATDVTLHVPGMYWSRGWPDRVRTALKTLPWVEQTSVRTDVKKREVLFNLKGESGFIEEDVRKALKGQGFPEVAVRAAPAAPDKKR